MVNAISEIVGEGELSDGTREKVYRALRTLLCATCGAEIAEDLLFTRRNVKGIGLSIMPQCRKCVPFTLRQDKKEKSALLQTLLGEERPDSSKSASMPMNVSQANSSPQEARNIADEVKRRLGPALKRGRRKL